MAQSTLLFCCLSLQGHMCGSNLHFKPLQTYIVFDDYGREKVWTQKVLTSVSNLWGLIWCLMANSPMCSRPTEERKSELRREVETKISSTVVCRYHGLNELAGNSPAKQIRTMFLTSKSSKAICKRHPQFSTMEGHMPRLTALGIVTSHHLCMWHVEASIERPRISLIGSRFCKLTDECVQILQATVCKQKCGCR